MLLRPEWLCGLKTALGTSEVDFFTGTLGPAPPAIQVLFCITPITPEEIASAMRHRSTRLTSRGPRSRIASCAAATPCLGFAGWPTGTNARVRDWNTPSRPSPAAAVAPPRRLE